MTSTAPLRDWAASRFQQLPEATLGVLAKYLELPYSDLDHRTVAQEVFTQAHGFGDLTLDDLIAPPTPNVQERLEYLRGEIRAERISYGEIAELQGLAPHIDASDVELLEWAGVKEHADPVYNVKVAVVLLVRAPDQSEAFDAAVKRVNEALRGTGLEADIHLSDAFESESLDTDPDLTVR